MTTVITYGTYDLLHYGHIRLLERAKALGDYLIVGITADDFDKTRGKINVQQSLAERIKNVMDTGLADQIVIEEYEGQKIDDIQKYKVDIFTVGSDWVGKFDYLNKYCKVVYLERTQGISSSDLRSENSALRLGIVGNSSLTSKIAKESSFVNGVNTVSTYTKNKDFIKNHPDIKIEPDYDSLLDSCDAVFIISNPKDHYAQIRRAIEKHKHVICESPLTVDTKDLRELEKMAEENGTVLMESIKTAYSTAYNRMILMVETGKIGKVVSIDATCTSLKDIEAISDNRFEDANCSMYEWGPTALLPILQLFGTDYTSKKITSYKNGDFDLFSKIDLTYPNGTATAKVGAGVKSEGDLVISGTKGYIYVPSPWWKTDYFEIRYENFSDNRRYFYQLDGEGIRNELVVFARQVKGERNQNISKNVSERISSIMMDYGSGKDVTEINPQ